MIVITYPLNQEIGSDQYIAAGPIKFDNKYAEQMRANTTIKVLKTVIFILPTHLKSSFATWPMP